MFVVSAIGSWVGGVLADRWRRTNTTILMLSISGICAILIGLLFHTNIYLILFVGLIWGFTSVVNSAQFSTMVTETADQSYVGAALTIQLATGFAATVVTIWLIPVLQGIFSWQWAFTFLVPGPIIGILAMLRLKSLPEAAKIGGEKGELVDICLDFVITNHSVRSNFANSSPTNHARHHSFQQTVLTYLMHYPPFTYTLAFIKLL